MQIVVLLLSLALMALVTGLFWNSVTAVKGEPAGESANKRRGHLIVGLVVFGAILTLASLKDWPHAAAASDDAVIVNVTGGQWWWEIDREEVPLGKAITFLVTSEDVTHGMGVYDSDLRLLFQTQGMPGYVNKVSYVFEEPGTYQVLCMEYCGLAHHDMITEFQVLAAE